jgi:hypothetical protein
LSNTIRQEWTQREEEEEEEERNATQQRQKTLGNALDMSCCLCRRHNAHESASLSIRYSGMPQDVEMGLLSTTATTSTATTATTTSVLSHLMVN